MNKNHKHYPVPEMVDLGLPSGLKWAKWNVGASKVTGFGLYFKYGETEGHTSNELAHFDTNYPAEFADAATAAYGAGYRMPTKAELDELVINTNHYVICINGVKGMRFVSKFDGSKHIFIPFAGCCYDGSFYGAGAAGAGGSLWSRTLSSTGVAWYLGYASCGGSKVIVDGGGKAIVDECNRCNGYSIRAVSE